MSDQTGQRYTEVWLRWGWRLYQELVPTHGRRGAVAAILRESRSVTATARLIRWELRENLDLRDRTKAA